jgi:hypothetical protein
MPIYLFEAAMSRLEQAQKPFESLNLSLFKFDYER